MPDSPTPNTFGFKAEATDYSTGLQYLRARYYDTNIGRFAQEDTYRGDISNSSSLNRYAYVYNNPVNYVDLSGFRPIELATVNTHTMQQVKKTTHKDLLKEYEEKRLRAIAREQEEDLRQIQEMKKDNLRNSQIGQGNSGTASTPADDYSEKYCSFDAINAQIYDDMDFTNYSLSELQALYDKIDALDVGKKAFDNVSNKNQFMRQLKKYINNNTLKEEKENSLNLGTLASGNTLMIGGAIAIAVCATILTGGAAAPFMIAAAVGLAGGTATMMFGGAEVVESFTGDNYIKDDIYDGNEKSYNTAKIITTATTAVATAFAAAPTIIASLIPAAPVIEKGVNTVYVSRTTSGQIDYVGILII